MYIKIYFAVTILFFANVVSARDSSDMPVWKMTVEQVQKFTDLTGTGKNLKPASWPDNNKVAVLFSFDVDNEPAMLVTGERERGALSIGEFGARRGIKRIVKVLDDNSIPATFFTPVLSLQLDPEMIDVINQSGVHEYAAHGWTHEPARDMPPLEQRKKFKDTVSEIKKLTGQRPVGFRAPYSSLTDHTLPIMKELGFLYDSSFMADDLPYELNVGGKPSGLVELPPSFYLSDATLAIARGRSLYTPREVLEQAKDAFDVIHNEGGMMIFVMHPHVGGRASRIVVLKELINYMKQRDDVWFATHKQAAKYLIKTGLTK